MQKEYKDEIEKKIVEKLTKLDKKIEKDQQKKKKLHEQLLTAYYVYLESKDIKQGSCVYADGITTKQNCLYYLHELVVKCNNQVHANLFEIKAGEPNLKYFVYCDCVKFLELVK